MCGTLLCIIATRVFISRKEFVSSESSRDSMQTEKKYGTVTIVMRKAKEDG